MKEPSKILFVEGTSDTSNGVLRQGFHKLLQKKLAGKMPRIVMGDGKTQAIKKFLNNRLSDIEYLLVDLDGTTETREDDLKKHGISNKQELVFYMIQEMEAWFISQPDILDEFYKTDISKKIPKRPPQDIPAPAKLLEMLTGKTQKGKYHKVQHGTALLEMLDADKLEQEFQDFADLVKKIAGNGT